MAVDELGSGKDDGSRMGRASTDKIGFLGATPVVVQSVSQITTTATEGQVAQSLQTLYTALETYGLLTLT